ncbi:MAG: DUF2155 domain-containing protein [Pseudomonadota bacterium]
MLITALLAAAALQSFQPEAELPNEELLGWTVQPPAPVPGEETELDRLSKSASGQGFLTDIASRRREDPREPIAVTLRALDKITTQFTDLVVPIGEAQDFGSLTLVPRTCSTRPPEEFPETTVFLEVYASETDVAGQRARTDEPDELEPLEGIEVFELEQPQEPEVQSGEFTIPVSEMVTQSIDEAIYGEAIFKGWMFASTPSLNALQHPTYDVWVIACSMEDPDV